MDTPGEYYQDKVAVATGGASGIGLALAETRLCYEARKVVLADFEDTNLQLSGPGDGRSPCHG